MVAALAAEFGAERFNLIFGQLVSQTLPLLVIRQTPDGMLHWTDGVLLAGSKPVEIILDRCFDPPSTQEIAWIPGFLGDDLLDADPNARVGPSDWMLEFAILVPVVGQTQDLVAQTRISPFSAFISGQDQKAAEVGAVVGVIGPGQHPANGEGMGQEFQPIAVDAAIESAGIRLLEVGINVVPDACRTRLESARVGKLAARAGEGMDVKHPACGATIQRGENPQPVRSCFQPELSGAELRAKQLVPKTGSGGWLQWLDG